MRTMYDSVTATNIPTTAAMVAGYVSGRYTWSAADWARFPNAVKVRIATQASVMDGHVLDVEPGDATPAEAVDWVISRRKVGMDPTVYCNRNPTTGLPAVQAAFRARGVAEPHYWVATASKTAGVIAGSVATQYMLDYRPPGWPGTVDISSVADVWPGVDTQGVAEMELTDNVKLVSWGPNPPASANVKSVNNVLAEDNARLSNIENWLRPPGTGAPTGVLAAHLDALTAQNSALISAVAALASNPDITPDQITAALDAAVAAHLKVTVAVSPTA
jgi:hypothetical protein